MTAGAEQEGLPRERFGVAALQWEVLLLERLVESVRAGERSAEEAVDQLDESVLVLKRIVVLD